MNPSKMPHLWAFALSAAIAVGACSAEDTANSAANGGDEWSVAENNEPATDMTPVSADMPAVSADMPAAGADMKAATQQDMPSEPAAEDMRPDAPTPDMRPDDPVEPDMRPDDPVEPDMSSPMGGMDGDGCGTTSECGAGLVCCASFDGTFSCTPENRCFTGGVCQASDECPGSQECCDPVGGFGSQKTCRDMCMIDTGCENNTECGAGEVCCVGFGGAPMCTPSTQCQTGGRCSQDSDCLDGKSCCTFGGFGGGGICLDMCGF